MLNLCGIVLCLVASFWAAAASNPNRVSCDTSPHASPDVVFRTSCSAGSSSAVSGPRSGSGPGRRCGASCCRDSAGETPSSVTALNNLKQGVVITDPRQRIVFLNDRYLDISGSRVRISRPTCSGRELLELRTQARCARCQRRRILSRRRPTRRPRQRAPNGQSVHVKHFPLSNGGSITTHEDCSEQRSLSRELASAEALS